MLSYVHHYAVFWEYVGGLNFSKCHTGYRPTLIGSYLISENTLVKILNVE